DLSLRVAHDIRSPLQTISALTNTELASDGEEKEILKHAISRLNTTADTLLDQFRSDRKAVIETREFSFIPMVAEAVNEKIWSERALRNAHVGIIFEP